MKRNDKKFTRVHTEREADDEGISPGTRRALWIIFLSIVAALSVLAFFNAAGSVGRVWRLFLATFFGRLDILAPVFVVAVIATHLFPERVSLRRSQWWGVAVLTISLIGLLHLRIPEHEGLARIGEESGGGYFGLLISYPLRSLAGMWGALAILFGLGIAGLVLLFNMTAQSVALPAVWMRRVWDWMRGVGRRIGDFFSRRLRLADTETRAEGVPHTEEDALSFTQQPLHQSAADHRDPAPLASLSDEDLEDDHTASPKPPRAPKPSPSPATLFPSVRRRPAVEVPLELLTMKSGKPTSGDIEGNKEMIQRTFANFHIEVEMGEVSVGPTVTQYTLRPAIGVKVSQITSLANDLALALAAHPIRIEAPIPGKSLVGIEVPNQQVALVPLRDCLTSDAFRKRKSSLSFAVGKDVAGSPWIADLAKMPHLLIAGATGSGKSVMINSFLISLLYQNQPEDLRLILVDPKRVELSVYNDIPHLLTPVVTEVERTINALRWVVGEMDRRFQLLSQVGKRNIESYNAIAEERIPYIVVVIDELADLMAVAAAEVEAAIIRLAQMARAVGIHLVVATQRPSVDVITGLIKANITARIAFAVASTVDSRTILDASGAEKLLGRGDLLFTTAELSKPRRLQGAFVSDQETERVVGYWKDHGGDLDYHDEIVTSAPGGGGSNGGSSGDDPRLTEARELVVNAGKASASFLQRRMSIGYARAARLLDLLEEEGTIGPGEGAKPREVLLSAHELHVRAHPAPSEDEEEGQNDSEQEEDGHDVHEGEGEDEDDEDELTEEEEDGIEHEDEEDEEGDIESDDDTPRGGR